MPTARDNPLLLRLAVRPEVFVTFSAVLLLSNHFAGPGVHFALAFALPVLAAAWGRRFAWAVGLSIALPVLHFGSVLYWGAGRYVWADVINMAMRIPVLLVLSLAGWRYWQVQGEVRVLRGLLPVCMHCKRIRDRDQHWYTMERYLREHSEASLSHGLCPECERKFYPEIAPSNGAHLAAPPPP